jgi:hypothetical protein
MPWSPLGARTRIPWSWSALVVVLPTCYKTLEFWIEYTYHSGMKMSCFSVRARCTMLTRQWICSFWGRIVLKFRLRWSVTWWRGAVFWCHRPVDRWVLTGGIDRFLIATPDHVDFSSFVIQISPRINLGFRVLIAGRAGLSIRSVVVGCLTVAWNMIAEFLSLWGNSKLIVIMHRSSCS